MTGLHWRLDGNVERKSLGLRGDLIRELTRRHARSHPLEWVGEFWGKDRRAEYVLFIISFYEKRRFVKRRKG